MKRLAKVLVPVFILMLVAALCAMPMSAADNVIFIKDGATGDGTSADSALQPTTGNYDPTASNPMKQADTAIYQASLKLKETGGTIVICGPVVLGKSQVRGNGANDRDLYLGEDSALVKRASQRLYDGRDRSDVRIFPVW